MVVFVVVITIIIIVIITIIFKPQFSVISAKFSPHNVERQKGVRGAVLGHFERFHSFIIILVPLMFDLFLVCF